MSEPDKYKPSEVATKCERCGHLIDRSSDGLVHPYDKIIPRMMWCLMCGYGSPAEVEQRERAERAEEVAGLGSLSVITERDQLRAELAEAKKHLLEATHAHESNPVSILAEQAKADLAAAQKELAEKLGEDVVPRSRLDAIQREIDTANTKLNHAYEAYTEELQRLGNQEVTLKSELAKAKEEIIVLDRWKSALVNLVFNLDTVPYCDENGCVAVVWNSIDKLRSDLAAAQRVVEKAEGYSVWVEDETCARMRAWAESHEGTWPQAVRDLLDENKRLHAELARRIAVEQEREAVAVRALQSIGRPTEGLTIFLLVQELVAVCRIVELCRQFGVHMTRHILDYEPGHYGRDWRKKLAVHLSELLDEALRAAPPKGEKG